MSAVACESGTRTIDVFLEEYQGPRWPAEDDRYPKLVLAGHPKGNSYDHPDAFFDFDNLLPRRHSYRVELALVADLSGREPGREVECLFDDTGCIFFERYTKDVAPGDSDDHCRDIEYGCSEISLWWPPDRLYSRMHGDWRIDGVDPRDFCESSAEPRLRLEVEHQPSGLEVVFSSDCRSPPPEESAVRIVGPDLPFADYSMTATVVDGSGNALSNAISRTFTIGRNSAVSLDTLEFTQL